MESAGFASEQGNRAGIVDQRAANRGGENVTPLQDLIVEGAGEASCLIEDAQPLSGQTSPRKLWYLRAAQTLHAGAVASIERGKEEERKRKDERTGGNPAREGRESLRSSAFRKLALKTLG